MSNILSKNEELELEVIKFREEVVELRTQNSELKQNILSLKKAVEQIGSLAQHSISNSQERIRSLEVVVQAFKDKEYYESNYKEELRSFSSMTATVSFSSYSVEKILNEIKKTSGVKSDSDLQAEDLKKLCALYKEKIKQMRKLQNKSVHHRIAVSIRI